MVQRESFEAAIKYEVEDLWSESKWETEGAVFAVNELNGCDNVTLKVKPL